MDYANSRVARAATGVTLPSTDAGRRFHTDVRTSAAPRQRIPARIMSVASSAIAANRTEAQHSQASDWGAKKGHFLTLPNEMLRVVYDVYFGPKAPACRDAEPSTRREGLAGHVVIGWPSEPLGKRVKNYSPPNHWPLCIIYASCEER